MRKITAALSAACLVGVGLIASASGASATTLDADHEGRVLVAWQMGPAVNPWPQTLIAAQDTNVVDLAAYDAYLATLPGCHDYQVDLYDDTEALDALLAFGVLGGDGSPAEPGVVTSNILRGVGTGCIPEEPPCTLYKTAVFEMPGFDPVVGKTFPQTLVSVSAATCTPTFPPPPDCKNTQQDIFRADGPLWALALEDGILTEAEGNNPALWAEMYEGGSGNSWRLYPATNCPKDATASVTITPPTCDAPSGISVTGLLFASLVGTLDLSVGTHTATFQSEAGHLFANGTNMLTVPYTIAPKDTTSEECIPDIGGKTIGYYKNHTVTAAVWNAAKAPYANAIPAGTTFAQAQALLNVSGSTNNGKDMLRAQFIATALNVQTIAGYGDQHITVPGTSAVDGGQVVTIKQYLADVNAAWAALDTKAEITSVKDVLDAINQDVASSLIV